MTYTRERQVDFTGLELVADNFLSATPYVLGTNAVKELAGLTPSVNSDTTMVITPGYCSTSLGTHRIINASNYTIDITINGIGGLDTGTATSGEYYFVYGVLNPTTGAYGFMFSNSISYTNLVKPTGYTLARKLPISFIYGAGSYDGIPSIYTIGWPSMPFYYFSGFDMHADWAALTDGAATAFSAGDPVDLTPFIPENSRIVDLLCKVTNDGGGAVGHAYIRTLGAQTGIPVGFTGGTNLTSYTYITTNTLSTRIFYYKVTGDALLSIYVNGYAVTEHLA